MGSGVIGVMIGVGVAVVLIFEVGTLGHDPLRLRDVATETVGLLGIALVMGYLAWRHRGLFVTAAVTAGVLIVAVLAGSVVIFGYLMAITPPRTPDAGYAYGEDAIIPAVLLGLGVAAGIVAMMAVLAMRLRRSSEQG